MSCGSLKTHAKEEENTAEEKIRAGQAPVVAQVVARHESADGVAVGQGQDVVPNVLKRPVVEAAAVHSVVHYGRARERIVR